MVYSSSNTAIDAEARSISVHIVWEELRVTIQDDGKGITETDFKLVGERNATSKHGSSTIGQEGCSLANIVDLAKSVLIKSNRGGRTMEKSWNQRVATKTKPAGVPVSRGTFVEVKGLFFRGHIRQSLAVAVTPTLLTVRGNAKKLTSF
jgi:DNA mismatch repair ATPase MutL